MRVAEVIPNYFGTHTKARPERHEEIHIVKRKSLMLKLLKGGTIAAKHTCKSKRDATESSPRSRRVDSLALVHRLAGLNIRLLVMLQVSVCAPRPQQKRADVNYCATETNEVHEERGI